MNKQENLILSFFIKNSKYLLFLILFSNAINCKAQLNNLWYFGNNAGLDFSTFPPKSISSNFPKYYHSHVAQCNNDGKLLFYSNGTSVFNSTGQIMQNGNNLLSNCGNNDSISSVLKCIKLYTDSNIYYLFYTGYSIAKLKTTIGGGLIYYYAVIDMSFNSGVGKVIKKNIPIKPNLIQAFFGKIDEIKIKQSNKSWLLFAGFDSLYVFKFDSLGIDTFNVNRSPFNAYWANKQQGGSIQNYHNGSGNMVINNKGDLLAICNNSYPIGPIPFDSFCLYHINLMNGLISNYDNLENKVRFYFNEHNYLQNYHPYQAQFSPNDSFLYLTYFAACDYRENFKARLKCNSSSFNDIPLLIQLDLYALNTDSALRVINTVGGCDLGPGMAMGPDGRLYISGGRDVIYNVNHQPVGYQGHYISYLEFPDKKYPACNLKCGAIKAIGEPWFTLPTGNYVPERMRFTYTHNHCFDSVILINQSDSLYKTFVWVYNNGKDSVSGDTVKIPVSHSGYLTFTMQAYSQFGFKRSMLDSIPVLKRPNARIGLLDSAGCQWLSFAFKDSSVCDTTQLIKVNNQYKAATTWLWSFGDPLATAANNKDTLPNTKHTYTQSGIYAIKLVYSNGFCTDSVLLQNKVNILPAPKPGFNLSDTSACIPAQIKIIDKSIGVVSKYLYQTSNGFKDSVQSPVFTFNSTGIFKIYQWLTGLTGCVTTDSATLIMNKGFDADKSLSLHYTSVLPGDNAVLVSWQAKPFAVKYLLEKSVQKNTSAISYQINDTFFIDHSVQTANQNFYYRVKAFDTCLNVSEWTLQRRPVLLKAHNAQNQQAVLNFTDYEGFNNASYSVFSSIQLNKSFVNIGSASQNTFTDVNFLDLSQNQKCYYIWVSNKNNDFTSYSNTVCVPYISTAFFPNAFTPNNDGLNDEFKPKTINTQNYHLQVFNKWGIKVFESNTSTEAWNGTYQNEAQPGEIYFYVLDYTNEKGVNINVKGNVMLMR